MFITLFFNLLLLCTVQCSFSKYVNYLKTFSITKWEYAYVYIGFYMSEETKCICRYVYCEIMITRDINIF